MAAGRAWVGTSGWSYRHWRGVFYPPGLPANRWLDFYCRHFDTVEVNFSFYRLPTRQSFEGWRTRTPADFRFAIKANRTITHLHRLKHAGPAWQRFWDNAQGLAEKLAVVLVQLPPAQRADVTRLADFTALLPAGVRFAFEFRHQSWFVPEVYAVLEGRGYALCQANAPGQPGEHVPTGPYRYLRMHGGPSVEESDYSRPELERWAASLRRSTEQGRDVFVYFNNDPRGYAVANARFLSSLLPGSSGYSPPAPSGEARG